MEDGKQAGTWGTDQIGVEIQHKDRLLADQGAIEDVLEQGRVDAFPLRQPPSAPSA